MGFAYFSSGPVWIHLAGTLGLEPRPFGFGVRLLLLKTRYPLFRLPVTRGDTRLASDSWRASFLSSVRLGYEPSA